MFTNGGINFNKIAGSSYRTTLGVRGDFTQPGSFDLKDKFMLDQAHNLNLIPKLLSVSKTQKVGDSKETIPVRNMYITLAGSPGAGKSTQGAILAKRYGIPHVSVGSLLRKEIADKTTLGLIAESYVKRGDLTPSNLVAAVVKNRITQPDCKNGFILDGYPRKMDDTEQFEKLLNELGIKNFKMVAIRVDPELVVERMKNRRVCEDGHSYDLKANPPKKEGICDIDGKPLIQREDDKPETIWHRFNVYKEETLPVIDYFRKKGAYTEVDGSGSIEEVTSRLTEQLDPKESEEA